MIVGSFKILTDFNLWSPLTYFFFQFKVVASSINNNQNEFLQGGFPEDVQASVTLPLYHFVWRTEVSSISIIGPELLTGT